MFLKNRFLIFTILIIFNTYDESSAESEAVTAACNELGDCIAQSHQCNNTIGFFYNDTTHDCVVNIKLLLQTLTAKYDTQDKMRLEVLQVFQGVIVSVILFVTCSSICVLGACIYCCRINYIDYRLKKDVEALAAKLKRDCNLKRKTIKKPTQPVSESCNIVVESAGVYVV
ncbi:PREDICTED: uncharacterized protein LOC106111244 [Papilio polytes]|uniref:uncharacterized protein LOC106111244 n=1 Tax=Papilio polytes TaxID=76194 RepID=UPI000675BCFB|nr:PREDICTED: uncharacterized protein LOC106111244 [Papilio polytes]